MRASASAVSAALKVPTSEVAQSHLLCRWQRLHWFFGSGTLRTQCTPDTTTEFGERRRQFADRADGNLCAFRLNTGDHRLPRGRNFPDRKASQGSQHGVKDGQQFQVPLLSVLSVK